MQTDETNPAAAGGPLKRRVRPLADQMQTLAALYHEDYGRELDDAVVRRAMDFAARHTEPRSVTAGPSGAVYFSWPELSVRFTECGETHWAGVDAAGARPFGSGEPNPMLWPCLRPNVLYPDSAK